MRFLLESSLFSVAKKNNKGKLAKLKIYSPFFRLAEGSSTKNSVQQKIRPSFLRHKGSLKMFKLEQTR